MKLTKISNLFDVKYGVNLELNKLEETLEKNSTTTFFVSRTDSNNGVSAIVQKIGGVNPIQGQTLTVAAGGSVLSTFLQPYSYYSGRDLFYLTPKKKMSERELIYYSICIRKNQYKYNYGRQANKTLKDILVPIDMPDKFRNLVVSDLNKNSLIKYKFALNKDAWKPFLLKDIFSFERGKCGSAEKLLEKGDEVSYVGAKKEDNGSMYRVKRDEKYVTMGNCVVFIGDGQGSVGYSTYQEKDFLGSTTLSMGRNTNLNKYNGLFIITLLDKERFKYSFGRKWNGDKLKNTKLRLPSNKNNIPDWKFMENYIKSLPFSAGI